MQNQNVALSKVIISGLWFGWVLANIIGVSVGLLLGKWAFDNLWIFAICAAPSALAVPLALSQWLVVRSQIPRAWLVATIIGLNVGLLLGSFLSFIPVLPYVAFGLTLGAAQWLVLRSRFEDAQSWIWANALAAGILGIAAALVEVAGLATANVSDTAALLGGIIIVVVVGAVFGGITGIALIRLFQHPKPQEKLRDDTDNELPATLPATREDQITKAEFSKLTYRQKYALTEYGYLLSPEDAQTVGQMLGNFQDESVAAFCETNGKKISSFEK